MKQEMHFALVRPLLEYTSSIWDNQTTSDIKKIKMVQRRATRFVSKIYQLAHGTMTHILSQLKWPTLQQRGMEQHLTIISIYQYRNILKDRKHPKPVNATRQSSELLHLEQMFTN